MASKSFPNVATVSASTKRAAFSGGKRSLPAAKLTDLKITQFFPVSADIQSRLGGDAPQVLLEVFLEGDFDIVRGDLLTVASVDYPIYALEKWPFNGTFRYRLMVEDLLI